MMKQVPATLREMYVQQANENGMVKKKLKLLDHYKLVGAVLIKQDWDEAKSNIIKRLKFIENEFLGSERGTGCLRRCQRQRGRHPAPPVCAPTPAIYTRLPVVQSWTTQATQTEVDRAADAEMSSVQRLHPGSGIRLGPFGDVGAMTAETVDFLICVLEDVRLPHCSMQYTVKC
ncbi:hypothetical protein PC119_g26365 [Phytophthora cactorum]|uniref:Uncharacterized protein n=1 Tax=Phytophthora cactorum TaxID=29920 RepID=A0A8T0Y0L1_9STRA|nr:hypothetical protein PC111_g20998 [Phytophthora cactorum]KAG2798147.1 hypothetical protein PC112_g21483 [Phytophthora cactorum]KAG2828553.1 hypothetical protein PC113_g21446 [Phytophthora cactorum]KAG2877245.1 hypothetical protein PC114_g23756 [Phytophthora cactorum]KAG2960548.1 hypothetical protein PC119_g26365 [Phytophthora cactorum]